jgi:hypothetical protein
MAFIDDGQTATASNDAGHAKLYCAAAQMSKNTR